MALWNDWNAYRTALFFEGSADFFISGGVRIGMFPFDGRPVRDKPLQKGGETDENRKHESTERRSRR